MRFCGHCGAAVVNAPTAPIEAEQASSADPGGDTLRRFVTGQVADRLIESGGQLSEERRLVTALFADLSGFTPLSERLDPEELLEVIDPIIRALSDIVGGYEGFVEKFAGDALLALFGAPVAHEDDAARALLVAIEMHRELARLRTALGAEAGDLTLHIGINSGHGVARMIGSAVRMDYAVLGDSVILAQRLESAAPPGETYVGETTYRLVQDRFEFERLDPLALKGKSEPVPAFRLLGERAAAERGPAAARHAAPLFGCDEEFRAVQALLDGLSSGTGGVITVVGEPGVGKSRLTDEARLSAAGHGIRWLEARCLAYGAGLAYWPFLDLLRRVGGIRVDDPLDLAVERLREMLSVSAPDAFPFFARLLGLPAAEGAALADLEPEAFRRGLHDAFASWLRALSAEEPLVMALEDSHWADASTVALYLELAHVLREDRVVLYLTARVGVGRLVDEMAGTDAQVSLALHLEPLDEHGIANLAAFLLDGGPPQDLLPVLIDRGAGNPFFVEETIRSLLENGAIVRTGGTWAMSPGWNASEVAPTIEGLLAARVDAMPTRVARLLGVASVIGRRVRLKLLRAIVPDAADLDASIGHLLAAGFLDEGTDPLEEAVVFHHALMQEVAYGRLLRRRRRELHVRIAEAAERLWGSGDDVIDLVARHLYLGNAGSRAVDYLLRAGDRAQRLFANEEALVHLSHAIELVRADATLTDLLPELLLTVADIHELRGSYDQARGLYLEARDLTGHVRAFQGIASTLRRQGSYDDALAAIDDAAARLEASDADLRPLWLERGSTLAVRGDLSEAIAAFRIGLSEPKKDVVTGGLLLQLALAETLQGASEDALRDATEARLLFETLGDQRGLATALRVVGDVSDDLGRLDEAAHALTLGLEVAERVGNAEELGACLVNLGFIEQKRGNSDAAIEHNLRAAAEFERIGHGSGRAFAYGNVADILATAGEYAEALSYAERALAVAEAIGHPLSQGYIRDTLAAIRAGQGDLYEAAKELEEAADLFVAAGATRRASEQLLAAADAWRTAGDELRAASLTARSRATGGADSS